MTLDDLKSQIEAGEIDTVLTCIVDMQGRLMGKRFYAEAFLEIANADIPAPRNCRLDALRVRDDEELPHCHAVQLGSLPPILASSLCPYTGLHLLS